MDAELRAQLEAEGWHVYEDGDGLHMWTNHANGLIHIPSLEIWEHVGTGGNRSEVYKDSYVLIAGPFDTLDAAKAAYMLLDDSPGK